MAMFSQTELRVVDALASGKSMKKLGEDSNLSEATISETVEGLKVKLAAANQSDIPARFAVMTGWSNAPKDYPQ